MQTNAAAVEEEALSAERKVARLRMACDEEIQHHQLKADRALDAFRKCLQSVQLNAQQALRLQEKLAEAKDNLRELEDNLVKALAVKTRKEAKHIGIVDSLSTTKARVEELKNSLKDQCTKRDEYKAILSQKLVVSKALEEKSTMDVNRLKDLEEAISWYNEALGFRIEGGHGVKFTFNKIDTLHPSKEYSFTIRHENDAYTLLNCDPPLEDSRELMQELNKNNGLFRFVRIMREKFRVAASNGGLQRPSLHPDISTFTSSAPASSISVSSRNDSMEEENEYRVESEAKPDETLERVNCGKACLVKALSPHSTSSVRRSSRLKGKKGP